MLNYGNILRNISDINDNFQTLTGLHQDTDERIAHQRQRSMQIINI